MRRAGAALAVTGVLALRLPAWHGYSLDVARMACTEGFGSPARLCVAVRLGWLAAWAAIAGGSFLIVLGVLSRPRRPLPPHFTCPACKATSYHPQDVKNSYCGRCHTFPENRGETW
jgi:hypothetical protein